MVKSLEPDFPMDFRVSFHLILGYFISPFISFSLTFSNHCLEILCNVPVAKLEVSISGLLFNCTQASMRASKLEAL